MYRKIADSKVELNTWIDSTLMKSAGSVSVTSNRRSVHVHSSAQRYVLRSRR